MSYIGNSPGVASQRVTTTLTATAAQTQFTTQSGYILGYVDVYLNGAKLVNGADFEAITGTYITLFTGALAGDVVELISYVPRGLTDGYTKAEADAKFLDVGGDTATGTLALAAASLTGNLTLTGGTANGVGFLNGSKVLTAGSALTFDGTTLVAPTLNLTNALGVAHGGTGQTTANTALNALLPTQTGNATKYLQTDGSNATWDAISISTADITGTLPTANGGTGLGGATPFASGGVVFASGTSALVTNSALTWDTNTLSILTANNSPINLSSSSTSNTLIQLTNANASKDLISRFRQNGGAGNWWDLTMEGSTNAFTFEYNDGELLRITSAGNVGIGTSNPIAQLELNRTNSGSYSTLRFSNTGAGGRSYEIGLGGNTAVAGYANNLYFYDASASLNRMVLTSAGRLGIGVNAPDVKLQVGDTSDVSIAMSNSSSLTTGNRGNLAMFNSANSTVGLIRFGAVTDNVGTDIQFYTRPAAGSLAQNMILSSVGNLNILNGSLAVGYSGVPAATLDLRGSGVVSQYMISSSGSAQQNQIVSLFNSGGGYGPLNLDGSVVQFKASGSIKATVSSTGLDVTGTLSATGNVSTTGNLTVGSSGNGDQAMTTLQGYAPNAVNGSYGRLLFSANTNYTGGARRFLLTNGLNASSFAIIRSADANTTPTLDANGAVSSGQAEFVIAGNGNVGISVPSPQQKLDVAGIIRLTPNTADLNYSADIVANYDSAHVFQINTKNNNTTFEFLGQYSEGGGANNRACFPSLPVVIGGTSQTSVSEKFLVKNFVDANSAVAVGIYAGAVGNKDLNFYGAGNSQFFTAARIRVKSQYYTDEGNMSFWTTSNNGANVLTDSQKMVILANGNVGINQTVPDFKLDIDSGSANGSSAVTTLRLKNPGTTVGDGARLLFTSGTSTTGGAAIAGYGVAPNSADLLFYAGGNSEIMRIKYDGNVGIGTNNPADTNSFGRAFDVRGSGGAAIYFRAEGTSPSTAFFNIGYSPTAAYLINQANSPMLFFTNAAEKMRVQANGYVSIGYAGAEQNIARLGVKHAANIIAAFESQSDSYPTGQHYNVIVGRGTNSIPHSTTTTIASGYGGGIVLIVMRNVTGNDTQYTYVVTWGWNSASVLFTNSYGSTGTTSTFTASSGNLQVSHDHTTGNCYYALSALINGTA